MEFEKLFEAVQIPVLGFGTFGMGGKRIPDRTKDKEEVEAIRAAINLGMTHIDTAESYAAGHTEELVGEAIKPYDRDDIFLTTKVRSAHLKYKDLLGAIEASLKRLEVEYVDLYLVHWPNPEIPLKETMRAMERCTEEGYTRFIGVSNFSASLIEEAQSYLKDQHIVANQVHYSLLEQGPAGELLPYCRNNNMILTAYRPLERGKLTKQGYDVLDELAEKHKKSQAQISLNWLISQDKVVSIPKASNIEHLEDNIGAVGWRLSDGEYKRLEESFRQFS